MREQTTSPHAAWQRHSLGQSLSGLRRGSVWFGEVAVFVDPLEQVAVDEDLGLHQAQGFVRVVGDLGDLARHTFGERLVVASNSNS